MPAKMTTEEFITKAKLVHGDKYDYSKTDLDNRDEKGRVCIICHEKDEKGVEHGEFPEGQVEQIDKNLLIIENKLTELQHSKGRLLDMSDVGLSVSRICCGLNCDPQQQQQNV